MVNPSAPRQPWRRARNTVEETLVREGSARQRSAANAAQWMVGLSALLFWAPVLGPFMAGFVGSLPVAGVGRATIATFVPAIAVAVQTVQLGTLVSLVVPGTIATGSLFLAVLFESMLLLIGALQGALIAG